MKLKKGDIVRWKKGGSKKLYMIIQEDLSNGCTFELFNLVDIGTTHVESADLLELVCSREEWERRLE